uniref:Uncharacterized protein LOC111119181 isoform X1 n=1 Tax=Crassostrea virginica TaxID=6565 RepID=A0A8B8CG54_CRAVI|nr:uncharacterized protein LOC111119181 isoform X1 [Crassostrea virginica]XP_022314782.1 uncharacterized protein LOC111119181 isoform X1 [Crassostrea virginica]
MDKYPDSRIYRTVPRSARSSPRRGTPDSSRNGSLSKPHQFLTPPDQHGGQMPGEGPYRRRSSIAIRAVKAVENVARRMSTPGFSIDKIEENLDREIKEDLEKEEEHGLRKILQSSCQDILHSKKVLFLIVLLNITDCLLVLAGLILDIHYIKEMLNDTKKLTKKFTYALQNKYPRMFYHLSPYDIHEVYNALLTSPFNCNVSATYASPVTNVTHSGLSLSNETSVVYKNETKDSLFTVEDLPSFLTRHHQKHEIETDIAHGFHKASIGILAVLSALVLLKVFCYGKQLTKRKMEMFDGVVVIASFVLDIVFIKGLTVYPLEETVQILAFLMPWRVIRVANSLVMAVLDQAHLQLKMVYKEKKAIEEKLEISNDNSRYNREVVNALRSLCETEGIPSYKVLKTICSCESPSKKKKKDGSFTKKITKKVNCLGSGVDRSSCPYGNIPDMNEVTLEHLHRIANKANFKSTFEDVNEASDSDAECGSLLDKNYNEP